jgi:hypothetical protein
VNDVKFGLEILFQIFKMPVQKLFVGVDNGEDLWPHIQELNKDRKQKFQKDHLTTFLPTRENIQKYFHEAVESTHDASLLYMHFSGHGIVHEKRGSKYEAFLPTDYKKKGVVKDKYFHDTIEAHSNSAKQILAYFDCCHSGNMLHIGNVDSHEVVYIGGCQENQQSADAQSKFGSSGAFTQSFIKILKKCLKLNKDIFHVAIDHYKFAIDVRLKNMGAKQNCSFQHNRDEKIFYDIMFTNVEDYKHTDIYTSEHLMPEEVTSFAEIEVKT